MRLHQLELTRYGKFTDYSIDLGAARPGAPDLHIVYGLNEAGKSTALSAYLDLLFGIEERSRYNFLHPYPSMQVGGLLEFDGREHRLLRVKQRTNSLLDGRGQAVNEAVLSVPLAGLTRDAYRTMFSLDDQTLEEGGNAIIASKGDLGELLFSASAGLADLGTILAGVKDDADRIYKRLGRSTHIAELKKQLVQLKAERDSVDTQASAHAGLVAAANQAQSAYDQAMAERASLKARHDELVRILRAFPLAAEHARLCQALAAFGALPTPPPEWTTRLPGLMTKTTALHTQISGTQTDLDRLDRQIAANVIDERVLALADRIGNLGEGMARFSTAQTDLPRRRAALADHEAVIKTILQALGQAGHHAPHELLLPAPLAGRLRDLIQAWSGLEANRQAAERELTATRDSLERASAERENIGAQDGAISAAALASINAALGVLRRSDHQARIQLAERSLSPLLRRFGARLDSLKPWFGTGDELRALTLPAQRQLDMWRTKATALDQRRSELIARRRELLTRKREDDARIAAIRAVAGAIDDTEALRLRTLRDEAWAAHRQTLDAASAATFAQAMRDDDAIAAARLAHTQDLADLRLLQQEAAVADVNLLDQEELLAEADAELAALVAKVLAAVPVDIGLTKHGDVSNWLEHIEQWSRRRQETLADWEALETSQDDLRVAQANLAHDLAVLAEAMTLAGFDNVEDLSASALMQAAETALAQGSTREMALAAAERTLRDCERDLLAREKDVAKANAASSEWQIAWAAALGETWFTDTAIGAVRETLDALADLPAALAKSDELVRRIQTMERDQEDFADALGAILAQLGETLDPAAIAQTARDLAERLEAARHMQLTRDRNLKEHQRLADILAALTQDSAILSQAVAQMTAFFGVRTLEDVGAALDKAAEKSRLLGQIKGLEGQIASELRAASLEAALGELATIQSPDAEREAIEASARIEDLEDRIRQLFAECSRAKDRLDAIGGDDAVARIDARRRTVLLEIEDRAMVYLRLRTGAMVAEKALRAYREKHRSSMMNRASDAFSLITRGDYSGLAARPEKDRETLIGLPRQGGSKLASDMSKGTQFQLYLALRLAGYQEFALSRPAVPFIADDIMETFDEPRSEEVFRLLGEMARIGQVIYLTHHRHLCAIAQAVVPGVRVHDLGG